MRLDIALVERNIASSRARAKVLIQDGKIAVDEMIIKKPAYNVADINKITLCGEDIPFVGRGGLKLDYALSKINISLDEKICLDIGASTGGFTDCMLQHGAKKVYAVDVGHDQLAQSLRQDKRVINLEGTDIRALTHEIIIDPIDFITIDVSFISLAYILPNATNFLRDKGDTVILIKPQFEAGRENIGKHGLVLSKSVHQKVLYDKLNLFAEISLSLKNLFPSPIRGGSGNIEYLAILEKSHDSPTIVDIKAIVDEAFSRKE